MKCLVVLVVCLVAVMASIPDGYIHGRYAFHGRYADKCGNDGFYYKNDYSFVICSNGNSYEQPCAPGSRNSGYDRYHHGTHYYYRDFCDVNLVDYGAGIPHGYGHQGAGYGYSLNDAHAIGYSADEQAKVYNSHAHTTSYNPRYGRESHY